VRVILSLLLLLACDGDKIGDTGPGVDSAPATDDSGPGDDGAGDSGDGGGSDSGGDSGGGGGDSGDTAEPEACADLSLTRTGMIEAAELVDGEVDWTDWAFEHGPGLAVGDFTGDGYPDAVMTIPDYPAVLLVNDGAGALSVSADAAVDGGVWPSAGSAAAADLDADGDLDVVLSGQLGEPAWLLWNQGGGAFTSEALPDSESDTMSITVADFDRDGLLDLFFAGFVNIEDWDPDFLFAGEVRGQGHRLYRQAAPGAFEDVTGAAIPAEVMEALTFQATALDAEGDGDIDLYLANDYGGSVIPNKLLLNDGQGTFTVAGPDCACEIGRFIMGGYSGDADGDGDADIYLTDIDQVYLLSNLGDGEFVDVTLATVERADEVGTSWGTTFVDLNMDGANEIVAVFGRVPPPGTIEGKEGGQVNQLLHRTPAGLFEECADASGFSEVLQSRSVAVADLDLDGRPDLLTAGLLWVQTWRNTSPAAPGISLALDAGPGNPHGLGARVDASWEGGAGTWWMLPGAAFSSSQPRIFAGLGGASQAELTVTWPDGATSQHTADAGAVTLEAP
jgi:hypothetical protein